jgi:3-hydroxyisobutyrate dehydrogenase
MPSVVAQVATSVGDAGAGKIVVDLSTTGPSATTEIAAALAARGVDFIGAPVSGGTVAAEKRTLTIMVSGKESVYKQIEPCLQAIGKNIFYLGADPSLAQTMKIINNTLCAVGTVASMEVLVFGSKAGLDPKVMLDVLNVSSGRSFATLEKIPQCILGREFPMRFSTELLHKDIKLCIDEAEKMGAPLWVSHSAREFLAYAITQGDGPKDYAHTIKHFEKWADAQFGVEKA